MNSISIYKIGTNKGAPRVYLEGRVLSRSNFIKGKRYDVKINVDDTKITLSLAENGSRVVSHKASGNGDSPVIDINSHSALQIFEGLTSVRVVMTGTEIILMPLDTQVRIKRRLDRLRSHMANGSITAASISHGGGVLSHALHTGLKNVGIKSELLLANDIRPEVLDQALAQNDAWSDKTIYAAAPMQELAYDRSVSLPEVDILEAGLPCQSASVSGRAKTGISLPEANEIYGHLVIPFIALIARLNPAVILYENVIPWRNTASMHMLRTTLKEMGYELHETDIKGEEWNVLEHRNRMALVAVTKDIKFDFADLIRPTPVVQRVGDILEDIPDNDPSWKEMKYLFDKQERDIAEGKGFEMNIGDESSFRINTLGKGYAKCRSTEYKLRSNTTGLLRQLTPVEHARVKTIPSHLILGASNTLAHEILGQSILYRPFSNLAELLGASLKAFSNFEAVEAPQCSPVAYQPIQLDLLAA